MSPRPPPSLLPSGDTTRVRVSVALPYGPGQEGVERVEPVVHVLVTGGLQQDPTVLRAHGKRVGCLQKITWGGGQLSAALAPWGTRQVSVMREQEGSPAGRGTAEAPV